MQGCAWVSLCEARLDLCLIPIKSLWLWHVANISSSCQCWCAGAWVSCLCVCMCPGCECVCVCVFMCVQDVCVCVCLCVCLCVSRMCMCPGCVCVCVYGGGCVTGKERDRDGVWLCKNKQQWCAVHGPEILFCVLFNNIVRSVVPYCLFCSLFNNKIVPDRLPPAAPHLPLRSPPYTCT